MTNNDEMERQRFENWFGKLSIPELLKSNQEMDGSMNPIVSIAWESWQASRQALEISLPMIEQQDVIGKPVACPNDVYLARGVVDGEAGEDDAVPGYVPVYRHPQNATPFHASTNPQIDNDRWIEWDSGVCPVPPLTTVVVRYRKGKEEKPARAGGYFWNHAESSVDIIAYRVFENDGRDG